MPPRAVGGLNVVIDDGERFFGRAHFAAGQAKTLESLRAGHFMDEMAVNVEKRACLPIASR